jgi:uncharacterized protein
MMRLTMQSRQGASCALFYDPLRPSLSREDGIALPVAETLERYFPSYPRHVKAKQKSEARLVLGRSCNFRCAYCHQAPGQYRNARLTPMPEDALVDAICGHVGSDAVVQFWGGEPLVYFEQMRNFTELFRARGFREFAIITNGSLLTREVTDFLLEHKFCVSLSHDGPGQGLRGQDPLSDPQLLEQIRRLAARPSRFSVNPVMTARNSEHQVFADAISGIIDPVSFGEAVPILAVDAQSAACGLEADKLEQYARQLYGYLYGRAPFAQPYSLYAMQVHAFLSALPDGRGVPEGRHCTGTNPDALVVDVAGTVLPCQSFTADNVTPDGESFAMGHVGDSKERWRRPKARSWKDRAHCRDCPVVWFCRGCCPYQREDRFFQMSCQGRLHHYLALLGYAVSLLTDGRLLTEISNISSGEHHA